MLKGKLVRNFNKPVSFCWILMWSLSYIACLVIKPDLFYGGNRMIYLLGCSGLGLAMLGGLLFNVKPLLFGCGVLEVFNGVASWTGVIRWNVAWTTGFDPLAQINMALLDLISAVILFHYTLNKTNS